MKQQINIRVDDASKWKAAASAEGISLTAWICKELNNVIAQRYTDASMIADDDVTDASMIADDDVTDASMIADDDVTDASMIADDDVTDGDGVLTPRADGTWELTAGAMYLVVDRYGNPLPLDTD